MKKAIYLGVPEGWKSDAKLYRLTDPDGWAGRRNRLYVVVSGADLHTTTGLPMEYFKDEWMPRYETYIFRSTRKGRCLDWIEMAGSFRGAIDHERALNGLGYSSV